VRYLQGRYEEAKEHYLAAHAVYSKANDIHPSTSSTEVRLGCIAMEQNCIDEAMFVHHSLCVTSSHGHTDMNFRSEWFQKALLKCKLNESEKGDQGDTARVMRKLSQALERKGMASEAVELATKARNIRRTVQGERFLSLTESDYAYDLMIFVPFR
jgi:tetratricopeptide (TPR) repeat protein